MLTARVAGVGVNSACGEAASGAVEEFGCWSGDDSFCGMVAGCFWFDVAPVLPVVPMVEGEGWVLFCPAASGADIVLFC